MGRFGFEQNLLLLTLCRLRFDPNVVAGDLRPVNDVLQRDLQAWWPLVGTEAYDPHNQLGDDEPALQLLGEFSLSLSASRHSMGLIDRYFDKDNTNNHRGFTGDMLRGRLQQLLMDIDRVSVWSIARPIPTRPSKESPRTKIFSWKEDLKIVALSLGFYHSVHGDISVKALAYAVGVDNTAGYYPPFCVVVTRYCVDSLVCGQLNFALPVRRTEW